jgi:glycosyltransferase involved in cell wall biosynthesis
MKILYLITQAEMGGAQKYVLELSSTLQKKGYETLVASEKNELFKKKLSENGVKFIALKNIQRSINPISDIKTFFEIYNLIKKEKPDIIHTNSSKMGIFGAFAGKLTNTKKIVFTAHGWVFNETLPLWKKYIYIFLSWFSALFLDDIICVSSFDKKMALKYGVGSEKKLFVINNGIDPEKTIFFSKEEAIEKLRLPKNKKIIGTIGNLYKNKGTKYLIEAAKDILKEIDDVFFVIIGDGLEKENLEAQIEKLKIENEINIVKVETEAYKYIKAFDIFVLPSQKEGFPYTLLEAGLAKVPVVTTSVGGISDIINNETGVLIMPKNSTQIKNAVLNLLKNEKKQTVLTKNLHQEILQNFTFKKMIEKTKNIYLRSKKTNTIN